MTNILWLRRDLNFQDNVSLHKALREPQKIQPVFVFDTDILQRFTNKRDRRISFIANALELLNKQAKVLILHGSAREVLPKLAAQFGDKIFAGEDYEPSAIERDKAVAKAADLVLSKQHLLLAPGEVLKENGEPYKVFTPYSKAWRAKLSHYDTMVLQNNFAGRMANEKPEGFKIITATSAAEICQQIGYEYVEDNLWQPKNAHKVLQEFIAKKENDYSTGRDFPAKDFTSTLSPYLRFGLITARECYVAAKNQTWINELIWREFYAMILYHFPNTIREEFLPQYRKLKWGNDAVLLQKWKEGRTGYLIVDAGMRQLLQTGWMHNRVRMIVASFLTKDLLLDWRLGEEHFAQHLMDYEQASNVGGWQWASSTGTDAAPYFRVFNPSLQSKRFDPNGDYIRKYVPEFAHLDNKQIHNPQNPIINHELARKRVLEFFKKI